MPQDVVKASFGLTAGSNETTALNVGGDGGHNRPPTSLVKELRRTPRDRDPTAPIIRTSHGVGYACATVVEPGPPGDSRIASHWIDAEGRRIRLGLVSDLAERAAYADQVKSQDLC
jgi:hypothetical protein